MKCKISNATAKQCRRCVGAVCILTAVNEVHSLQLKHSYQRKCCSYYRTPRGKKKAAFSAKAKRNLHKQIVFGKGTNRLHPLNADITLQSRCLSCISLVLALCIDMYIATSQDVRSQSTHIKNELAIVNLTLCILKA
jgi:hypothetical protein